MKRCISWKPLQRIGVCIPERAKDLKRLRAKDLKRLAGIEEIEGERQEAHTWERDKPALYAAPSGGSGAGSGPGLAVEHTGSGQESACVLQADGPQVVGTR